MFGDIFLVVTTGRETLLKSSGWGPGLLQRAYSTRDSPTTESYLAWKIGSGTALGLDLSPCW